MLHPDGFLVKESCGCNASEGKSPQHRGNDPAGAAVPTCVSAQDRDSLRDRRTPGSSSVPWAGEHRGLRLHHSPEQETAPALRKGKRKKNHTGEPGTESSLHISQQRSSAIRHTAQGWRKAGHAAGKRLHGHSGAKQHLWRQRDPCSWDGPHALILLMGAGEKRRLLSRAGSDRGVLQPTQLCYQVWRGRDKGARGRAKGSNSDCGVESPPAEANSVLG